MESETKPKGLKKYLICLEKIYLIWVVRIINTLCNSNNLRRGNVQSVINHGVSMYNAVHKYSIYQLTRTNFQWQIVKKIHCETKPVDQLISVPINDSNFHFSLGVMWRANLYRLYHANSPLGCISLDFCATHCLG